MCMQMRREKVRGILKSEIKMSFFKKGIQYQITNCFKWVPFSFLTNSHSVRGKNMETGVRDRGGGQ